MVIVGGMEVVVTVDVEVMEMVWLLVTATGMEVVVIVAANVVSMPKALEKRAICRFVAQTPGAKSSYHAD